MALGQLNNLTNDLMFVDQTNMQKQKSQVRG